MEVVIGEGGEVWEREGRVIGGQERWWEGGTSRWELVDGRGDLNFKFYFTLYKKFTGTCCLGDLSLAIKDDSRFQMELKGKSLGLAPYLSPELLDDAIPVSVDSLKKADVYALGLVFWEIARRCSIQGRLWGSIQGRVEVGPGFYSR